METSVRRSWCLSHIFSRFELRFAADSTTLAAFACWFDSSRATKIDVHSNCLTPSQIERFGLILSRFRLRHYKCSFHYPPHTIKMNDHLRRLVICLALVVGAVALLQQVPVHARLLRHEGPPQPQPPVRYLSQTQRKRTSRKAILRFLNHHDRREPAAKRQTANQ